jgi:hypothetical protein
MPAATGAQHDGHGIPLPIPQLTNISTLPRRHCCCSSALACARLALEAQRCAEVVAAKDAGLQSQHAEALIRQACLEDVPASERLAGQASAL